MPIRWSALQVSEAADKIEEQVNQAAEPLEQARLVAQGARHIPNLPKYMEDCFTRIIMEIGRAIGGSQIYPVGYVNAGIQNIRDRIPEKLIQTERKAEERGDQQSLM